MLSIAAFEKAATHRLSRASAPERTGAPVVAFCRIADGEIRLREPVLAPEGGAIFHPDMSAVG